MPPNERLSETKGGEVELVRQYLNETGRHELLTAEQEVDLAKSMEAGLIAEHQLVTANGDLTNDQHTELNYIVNEGKEAKAQFISSNLRLVVNWAKRYRGHGVELPDLIQEGNLGLIRGVEKFDYRKGFKFSTYGTWWIRQSLNRAVANHGRTIRLPAQMRDAIIVIRKAQDELMKENGHNPTFEEIAVHSGLNAEKVEHILVYGQDSLSLSSPVGEDGAELGDFVSDGEDVGQEMVDEMEVNLQVDKAMKYIKRLSEKEQIVLAGRYPINGDPASTLDKLGQDLELTRERIRQIEKEALLKIRYNFTHEELQDTT